MKANFEKRFDNSYSYFREIQILTYLNQRGASVPMLMEGFSKEKMITMEFVGENLYGQRNVLSFQTKLKTGGELDANDWLFFDIIPFNHNKTNRSRFTYKYKFVEQIIFGLKELDNTLEFITKEQPHKPQKRNDYED